MQRDGLPPNEVTFSCILKACGSIGAIDKGLQIHDVIVESGFLQKSLVLATALVDMYAKCGMLARAQQVLEEGVQVRDVVSWSVLIAGYAQDGQICKALDCFQRMQKEGLRPDDVAFVCVLNACTHSGNLDVAQRYYEAMSRNYGIVPKLEHHTCMVVIFGCAGRFDKVMSVIKTMSSSDETSVWLALLGACRKWGNAKLGRLAFDQATHLDKHVATAYVAMADIYAAAGMYGDAAKVEKMRIENGARKKSSWVDAISNLKSSFIWDGKPPGK
jgi:pentatricopeptide repeat protein